MVRSLKVASLIILWTHGTLQKHLVGGIAVPIYGSTSITYLIFMGCFMEATVIPCFLLSIVGMCV